MEALCWTRDLAQAGVIGSGSINIRRTPIKEIISRLCSMRLPADTSIAPGKLSAYLLRRREDHDKAGWLALAGYGAEDAPRLEKDIRVQLLPLPAVEAGEDQYGWKYIIRGPLTGPNGRTLRVFSVWMQEKATGMTKFITLYSDK